MTRVSENSNKHALNYAVSQTKRRLEDLQLKGSTLKKIMKPSDDPSGNVQYLELGSRKTDNNQYIKNSGFAKSHIEYTENAIEDLTEVLMKAKDLSITQSSDLYNKDIRYNVSKEMRQLYNQTLAIANRRMGNRYIFSGYKTLARPFDNDGNYLGDKGRISVEITKDFYAPINLHGEEVFFGEDVIADRQHEPTSSFPQLTIPNEPPAGSDEELPKPIENKDTSIGGRDLASVDDTKVDESAPMRKDNIFGLLKNVVVALENNDSEVIQNSLEKFDSAINRLITMRTRLGSIYNSIEQSMIDTEEDNLTNAARRSLIADADVAELYSDLSKQQHLLQATYKSGQALMKQSLIDFLM